MHCINTHSKFLYCESIWCTSMLLPTTHSSHCSFNYQYLLEFPNCPHCTLKILTNNQVPPHHRDGSPHTYKPLCFLVVEWITSSWYFHWTGINQSQGCAGKNLWHMRTRVSYWQRTIVSLCVNHCSVKEYLLLTSSSRVQSINDYFATKAGSSMPIWTESTQGISGRDPLWKSRNVAAYFRIFLWNVFFFNIGTMLSP